MPTPAKKVIPIKQISAWSFSRYSTYVSCPRKAKYTIIDRLSQPGSAAMDRGTAIHKLAEDFALKRLKKLPAELALFKEEFMALKKEKSVICEEQWAFTKDWDPCGWSDWNNAWCRVKMDCAYVRSDNVLVIIDHKTGKIKDDHKEQLSLYALAGLVMYPDVVGVEAKLWYLDAGEEVTESWDAEQYESLKKLWAKKVKAMLSDKTYKPKPGVACRWCHFRKGNDGPCEF